MSNFHRHIVTSAPPSAYYMPNFITEKEEEDLLTQIYLSPKPKWTRLSNRRLQNWGGLPHPKGMVADHIPEWLGEYLDRLECCFDGRRPNHVLVNEYEPGQGIMPHVDGPLFYPTITTISLASHTVLDFYKPCTDSEDAVREQLVAETDMRSRYMGSFFLERRSMVCFKDDMYHKYLHGIAERLVDNASTERPFFNADQLLTSTGDVMTRETRVSLTVRHFPKVLKAKLKLFNG